MESLNIAVGAVLPVCMLLIIGYGIKKINLLSMQTFAEMNKLIFSLFLPVVLLNNIIKADLASAIQPKLLLYCLVAIVIIIGYGVLLVGFVEQD